MNVFAKEYLTLKMRLAQEGIFFFEESFVLITTATQTVTQSLGRGQRSWLTHTHTHTHTQAGSADSSMCVSKEKESIEERAADPRLHPPRGLLKGLSPRY